MPRLAGCPVRISFTTVPLTDGDHDGTAITAGGVHLVRGEARRYVDPHAPAAVPRQYTEARWSSPVVEPGFAFTELVPTWHAHTPQASWVEVSARIRSAAAAGPGGRGGRATDPGAAGWSRWLVVARWAEWDTDLHPTSVPGEQTAEAGVATDTVLTSQEADAWQLRVSLLAHDGHSPVLRYAGAMVSAGSEPETSAFRGPGRVLAVAPLSQRVHAGHYPRWGGGGDTWCSPTSIAMVLAYWQTGPDPRALAWIEPEYPDPVVYHAVRHCWDHAYQGAGNWSFNAAYAGRFGLDAFVTRLRGLDEAASFIAAGIPLIASVRVDPAELTGAGYRSGGHLLVLAGFTDEGDVIVNDPAAPEPTTVRRVYRRKEFDRAWLGGSGRIVYVIHPPQVALPERPAEPNW